MAANEQPNDATQCVPASLTDNLLIYNQPVILHAFFQLEEEAEQLQRSTSAALPRAVNGTGTVSKGDAASQDQEPAPETKDQRQVLEGSQASAPHNPSRGQYGLPESASVPGTLNKMRDSRNSVHAFTELSKVPSSQPPRAWFVSLEGKPAAEIRYAVSEQQRRQRPSDSRETSLDSGVDMSELSQTAGRRNVTLERSATFVKSSSATKPAAPQ